MKTKILWATITAICLALAGAIGVGSYLVGHQEGTRTPRNFVRGYTILTPEILKNPPPDANQSDLGFDDFETILDVAYGPDSLYNKLNLFIPRIPKSKFSIVINIHGGGTSQESKGKTPSSWTIPLLRSGIAVAQVDYRPFYVSTSLDNSGGFPFPSQIDDCKAAIRFLRANAPKYKLETAAFGVIGESFGGYLSALAGTTGEIASFGPSSSYPNVSSAVKAACCISGMTDMRVYVKQADAHRFALGYDWPELDTTGRFYVEPMSASQKEQSSPAFHVNSKTPPFLIVQGFDDPSVPPYQADRLFVRLRNANVDADCLLIPGASHGGPPLETLSSRKLVADFFRKHLLDN